MLGPTRSCRVTGTSSSTHPRVRHCGRATRRTTPEITWPSRPTATWSPTRPPARRCGRPCPAPTLAAPPPPATTTQGARAAPATIAGKQFQHGCGPGL